MQSIEFGYKIKAMLKELSSAVIRMDAKDTNVHGKQESHD
jgi:hypothetical protein